MSDLIPIPAEFLHPPTSAPPGPLGHPATWHGLTPHGDVWQRWADHEAALWGDGVPTVLVVNDHLRGTTASPATRTHESIPSRGGLRLVVGGATGVVDQPRIRFFADPRTFTRAGQLVRARLGDTEWTMRWWGVRTAAVEREGRRIAEFSKGATRWALDPAAGPHDCAVALALLRSVSSAADPVW